MPMVPGTAPPSRRQAGGEMLDQPPTAPMDQMGASAGLTGGPVTPQGMPSGPEFGLAGLTGNQPPAPADALNGFVVRATQLDQDLLALAQAAPMMGPKLAQMRTLLQQAMAEFVQSSMLTPEPTGSTFMGGMGSAR